MNRAPSEVPDEGVLIGTAVLCRGIVRVAPSSTPQVRQNRLDSGTSEPHAGHVIGGSVYHARPATREAATKTATVRTCKFAYHSTDHGIQTENVQAPRSAGQKLRLVSEDAFEYGAPSCPDILTSNRKVVT